MPTELLLARRQDLQRTIRASLDTAGFNVCTNGQQPCHGLGIDPVVECRERLEAMGIAVCGAGKDIGEARKPAIVECKGTRVAFVGYLPVGPLGYEAEKDKPGVAPLRHGERRGRA
jgi:hypothetical protein